MKHARSERGPLVCMLTQTVTARCAHSWRSFGRLLNGLSPMLESLLLLNNLKCITYMNVKIQHGQKRS